MNAPIYYDEATLLQNAVAPGAVHPRDNITTRYYVKYLLKRAMSVLKFENVPETWDINYFQYVLYCRGYVCVINSPTFGVIPQSCYLTGYNIYRAPTTALVANPALPVSETGRYWLYAKYNKAEAPRVKGSCVLVRLQPDFSGLLDVCAITAERLALMHESLMMNLANSKLAYIIGASDKGMAETFKDTIDNIQSGNLAVAVSKRLWDANTGSPLWTMFTNNLRQNYIGTDILEDMRAELNDFNNFVGIPSTNYNKKAHMTVDEINANDVETESLVDIMYECVSAGIAEVNKRFGTDIKVSKRYETNEGDGKYGAV